MFCRKCGKEMEEGALFCDHCGAKIEDVRDGKSESNKQVVHEPEKVQERVVGVQQPEKKFIETRVEIPPEYKPISMWGYFGYEILFSIPCIGIILLLVFAFGGTSNVNLKNFARSYFCFLIVCIVVLLLSTAVLIYDGASNYSEVGMLYNIIVKLI